MEIIKKAGKWLTFILPLALVDLFVGTFLINRTYGDMDISALGVATIGTIGYCIVVKAAVLALACLAVMWLNKDSFYQKIAWTRLVILSLIVPLYDLFSTGYDPVTTIRISTVEVWWLPLISYVVMIPLMLKHEGIIMRKQKR